ncbi:MAG TPA: hypothetical protein VHS36_07575 [Candidatus Limnocylindrales bacterium]|nr:hypothetical protein [Candidatus Limnocylindrales bacterium]
MSDPRAFLALDLGAATSSVALIGRLAHRWRLLGSLSLPAPIDPNALGREVVRRAISADPGLATAIGLTSGQATTAAGAPLPIVTLPRLIARSVRPQTILVCAANDRAREPFLEAARMTGWRTRGATLDGSDPIALTSSLLDAEVDVALVGAGDPPGPDERRHMEELAAIVAGAVARRPELTIILAGAMADQLGRLEGVAAGDGRGEILLGPAPTAGDPPGSALRELLDDVRGGSNDPRRAAGRAAGALADVLDRRVELIEIGFEGGLRATASPGVNGGDPPTTVSIVADAALVPVDPGDATVDRVLSWTTLSLDRHRLRDRLRELRLSPWGGVAGDGARLRLAAARAAMSILVKATPEQSALPAPDLVVVAGGAFAAAPGPAIALALADVIRHPGVVAVAYDHARLLGPLGMIPDGGERRQAISDLADDLLAPLGSVVIPGGIRAGTSAGTLTVHTGTGASETDLVPGGLELVDLPPGEVATAEFHFRDMVRLGTRGRRFAVDVSGGLGGLLVDLRDVPLRLPDRPERRRELLDAWQESLWMSRDR